MTATAERLTTGWEPDLALGDTLVRHYVHGLAATCTGPVRAMGGRVLEGDGVIAADRGGPNGLFNSAVLTRPPAPDGWEATVAEVERFFAGGTGQVFLWSPWPTPDLRDRGWQLEGHPPVLIRPPGLPLPGVPPELDIRRVEDRETLADFARVTIDGFPFTELQPCTPDAWLDERVLGLDGHELYVGYVDGEAAVSGWLLVHAGLAVLVLGATLPTHRRRGYWAAMLGHRLAAAGNGVAASIFSDMSRPGAEQHGFLPITRFTLWHRDRNG